MDHETIATYVAEHLERAEHVEHFEAGVQDRAEGVRPIGVRRCHLNIRSIR
jgi:hypothetical protein